MRREVEDVCQLNGWNFNDQQGRGFAFQKWVGRLLCTHEGVDEENVATFTTNDLKFDVIIEDDEQKALYICQTKFVSVSANPDLIESEVHDFFQRHLLLRDNATWV